MPAELVLTPSPSSSGLSHSVPRTRAGVKLEEVELRAELFQDAGLPCEVVRGTVQRLHLRVPWKQLLKQPVVLEAAGVTLTLREREEGQWEGGAAAAREQARKVAALIADELQYIGKRLGSSGGASSLSGFYAHLWKLLVGRIQVSIADVHMSFQELVPDGPDGEVLLFRTVGGVTLKKIHTLAESESLQEELQQSEVPVLSLDLAVTELGIYFNADEMPDADALGVAREYALPPFDSEVGISGLFGEGGAKFVVEADVEEVKIDLDERIFGIVDRIGEKTIAWDLRSRYAKHRSPGWRSGKDQFRADRQERVQGSSWVSEGWRYAIKSALLDVRERQRKTNPFYYLQRAEWMEAREYINLYENRLRMLVEGTEASGNYFSNQMAPAILHVEEEKLHKMEESMVLEDILIFRSIAQMRYEHSTPAGAGTSEEGQPGSSDSQSWKGWLKWGLSSMKGYVSTVDAAHAMAFPPAPSYMSKDDLLSSFNLQPDHEGMSQHAGAAASPQCQFTVLVSKGVIEIGHHQGAKPLVLAELRGLVCDFQFRPGTTHISLTAGGIRVESEERLMLELSNEAAEGVANDEPCLAVDATLFQDRDARVRASLEADVRMVEIFQDIVRLGRIGDLLGGGEKESQIKSCVESAQALGGLAALIGKSELAQSLMIIADAQVHISTLKFSFVENCGSTRKLQFCTRNILLWRERAFGATNFEEEMYAAKKSVNDLYGRLGREGLTEHEFSRYRQEVLSTILCYHFMIETSAGIQILTQDQLERGAEPSSVVSGTTGASLYIPQLPADQSEPGILVTLELSDLSSSAGVALDVVQTIDRIGFPTAPEDAGDSSPPLPTRCNVGLSIRLAELNLNLRDALHLHGEENMASLHGKLLQLDLETWRGCSYDLALNVALNSIEVVNGSIPEDECVLLRNEPCLSSSARSSYRLEGFRNFLEFLEWPRVSDVAGQPSVSPCCSLSLRKSSDSTALKVALVGVNVAFPLVHLVQRIRIPDMPQKIPDVPPSPTIVLISASFKDTMLSTSYLDSKTSAALQLHVPVLKFSVPCASCGPYGMEAHCSGLAVCFHQPCSSSRCIFEVPSITILERSEGNVGRLVSESLPPMDFALEVPSIQTELTRSTLPQILLIVEQIGMPSTRDESAYRTPRKARTTMSPATEPMVYLKFALNHADLSFLLEDKGIGMSLGVVRLSGGLQVGAGGSTKVSDVSWEVVSLTLQPRIDEFGSGAGVKSLGQLLASVKPKKGAKSTLRLISLPGKPRSVAVEGLDCTVGCDGWDQAREFLDNMSSSAPVGAGPETASSVALEVSIRECQATLDGLPVAASPTIVLSRPCMIKIVPRENSDPEISVTVDQVRLEMPSPSGAGRGGRRPLAEVSGIHVRRSSGASHLAFLLQASITNVNVWASHSQLVPISAFANHILGMSQPQGPPFRAVDEVGLGQAQDMASFEVRVDVDKVALLLCDDRYGPAAPLLEAALTGLAGRGIATLGNSAEFSGCLEGELLLDTYSFNKVGWEPVLEPLSFQIEIQASTNKVSVKSCSPLELTLSSAGVETAALAADLLVSVMSGATLEVPSPPVPLSAGKESPVSKVEPESSPESSVIDEQFVPYWLSNFSGESLEVRLSGSSSGGYGVPHCLEVSSGSTAPLVVRSGSPSEQGRHCVTVGLGSGRQSRKRSPLRRQTSFQDLQRSFRALQLRPARLAGSRWSTPVPLEASARCSYAVESIDGGSMKFVCEIFRRAGGGREVRVRSAFGVRNCTSSSVDIRSPFPGDVEDGGVFRVRLESGKAVWLPAAAGRGGNIFFRPAPGKESFHARWSNPIRLGTGGPKIGDNWTIRCRLDNSGKSQSSWGCCATAETAAGAATDTEIVLRPPVEVANGLPVPVRFEIRVEPSFTYKEPPRPVRLLHELDVAPGEHRALPSDVDPAHDLYCRIYLKGYFWSSPVALPVRRQDTEKEETMGEVWLDREEGSGEKVRLRLLVGGVAGARNVRVVGALALHNHSGVPLEATDSTEKVGSTFWQSVPPLFSKDSPDVGIFASSIEEPLSPTAAKNLGKISTPEIAASHMRHSLIDALDEPSPITPLRALKSMPESCWPVLFNPTHDKEELTGSDTPDSTALVFRMAMGQSGPSRPILLDAPRYTTAVDLGTVSRKTEEEGSGPGSSDAGSDDMSVASVPLPESILLAVHVEEGAIHVHPQFTLVNCLSYPVFFRQAATSEASQNYLPPGHSCAIHQQNCELPMLVNFRPEEVGWDWSGSFSPSTPGRTLLKLRNRRGGPSGLVEAHIEERIMDTFRVTLEEYRNVFAPYRVDNCTRSLIGYHQKNCDTEEEFLRPYGSMVYTWDEPTLPHQLVVKLPGHGVLATVLLDDVDYRRKITVPGREDPRIPGNKLAEYRLDLAVSAEGPTRVLTVSDSDVHDTSGRAEPPGGPNPRAFRQPRDQPLFALLSSVSVEINRVGLSLVSERREVLYASIVGAQLEAAVTASKFQFQASLGRLQVDNTLHSACYPVMLSVPALSGQQKLETRSPSQRRPALVLNVAAWKDSQPGLTCISNAVAEVAPIDVALDMNHLDALVSLATHFREVCQVRPGGLKGGGARAPDARRSPGNSSSDGGASALAIAASGTSGSEKVYIENLSISPLVLHLSFSTTGWLRGGSKEADREPGEGGGGALAGPLGKWGGRALLLADMEEAPIYLRGLQLRHALMEYDAAASFVGRHYVRGLLQETYKVLASVSVLGDPLGLARNLGAGVWDFLHSPITGLQSGGGGRGGGQFTRAVLSGTRSLVSHTLFALSNAAYQMSAAAQKSAMAVCDQCESGALGRGAQEGTGPATPPRAGAVGATAVGAGAGAGVGAAGGDRDIPQDGSLLSALARGMVGLVAAPVRGAEREGLRGLVKGVAQGVIGAVAQPTVVVLGLTAQYSKSLRALAARGRGEATRARPPRYVVPEGLLRPYSRVEATGQNLLQMAAGGRFSRETYVFCQELRAPGSFVVLTEEHFLCFKEPFEGASAGPAGAQLAFAVPLRDLLDVRRRGVRLVALRLTPAPPLLPAAGRRGPGPPQPPFAHAAVLSRSEEAGAQLEALLRDQAPHLLA